MIVDRSSKQIDKKTHLYHLVSESKISLLSIMSDKVGTDEEQIRNLLEELLDEGALQGSFTPDGQRFFLSDIKVSTAPIVPVQDEGYAIQKANTKAPKLVFISGLVIMVMGYILRGLTMITVIMEPIGTAMVFVGIAVLAAGWLMISRADPPSNLK